MPSRARDKQLAKQYARRQAAKRSTVRRRRTTGGLIGAVVGVTAIVIGLTVVKGGNTTTPTGSPSVTTSANPTISPSKPGVPTKIGEVTFQASPPSVVACGGTIPKTAGEAKPQYDAPPDPKKILSAAKEYTAVVTTSCGTFEIKLLANAAPQTVSSFVFLARQGFFDGMYVHRISPDFVIQTGDPLGTGSGGPGYQFGLEVHTSLNFDHVGQVAMANATDPNTNGSQWFVTTGEASNLDQLYTIFGDVVSGMDVITEIGGVATGGAQGDTPEQAVYIESVTIKESPKPVGSPTPTGSPSP